MIDKQRLKLAGLYKQQLLIYQEMYAIAELQNRFCMNVEHAALSSLDEFNRLILKRRERMELIDGIGKKILEVKKQLTQDTKGDEQFLEDELSAETMELQEATAKIKVLLKEIISIDHSVRAFFQRNIEIFQNKIADIQEEKKLLKKYYRVPQQMEGYFIDYNK